MGSLLFYDSEAASIGLGSVERFDSSSESIGEKVGVAFDYFGVADSQHALYLLNGSARERQATGERLAQAVPGHSLDARRVAGHRWLTAICEKGEPANLKVMIDQSPESVKTQTRYAARLNPEGWQ